MQLKRIFLALFSALILIFSGYSQNSTDSSNLMARIRHFINASEWEHRSPDIAFGGGPSSAFICLLIIDSSGEITNTHLFSDFKVRDSIFAIFSRLGPNDFKGWKSSEYKGKTILIPIAFASPYGYPEYVRDLMESNVFVPGKSKKIVVFRPLVFGWAIRGSEFLKPLKKRNAPKPMDK